MFCFILSLLATQALASSDSPILVVPGGHAGQPGLYQCPEPSALCYSSAGAEVTWGSIKHKCIVEYPNGKGYCTVRLTEHCYAFEYEKESYPQCDIV
ncbi:hypothetical protein DSO57_1037382 [Entomophthora muscae]|uniref:Uncharacterized protein n=1 Tax=Entomophthora muscae TaxID=34485 RepID=A0ACC2S159_9FUNG|nr:hypothetical protein DSO57_1037382 [Entomophthora muscae]